MIKLQLINADIIYDTAIVTSRLFRKSFNCRYNPRMDYVPCLTLQSYEKWRSPLFGATGNFNHQILLYGILFLTFINTNVFYLLSFKFSRKFVKNMAFSFKLKTNLTPPLFFRCLYQARNVRCHVYMCFKGIDFVRISTILQFIWNCSDCVVNVCLLCYFHISAVVLCLTFSINEKQKNTTLSE